MANHDLRRDDPVYYKCALRGLIAEAKENGLKPDVEIYSDSKGKLLEVKVLFRNDIGECAGATVFENRD